MQIAEILRRKGSNVWKIRSVDTISDAVRKLSEARVGALVVTDQWGRIAGMISERDVINGIARDGAAALDGEVHELMVPDLTSCSRHDRIDQVMTTMTAHRTRHLPVMADDRLVGIVSLGDLVKFRLDEKEQEAEILRDITRAHV
jgi:CBS domain-containing protein